MNAHQRRVARRKATRYWGIEPFVVDGLFDYGDECFDDDEPDERTPCHACGGDGNDPMTDYLLPCEVCCGDGYFD